MDKLRDRRISRFFASLRMTTLVVRVFQESLKGVLKKSHFGAG
ncbi:MAG: hypothetical protein ACE5K2_00830 [Candidatus Zixiibacteriota bacterium]